MHHIAFKCDANLSEYFKCAMEFCSQPYIDSRYAIFLIEDMINMNEIIILIRTKTKAISLSGR